MTKYTAEFAAKVEHAMRVINHPKWREFDKSTVEAARAILRTAMALGYTPEVAG